MRAADCRAPLVCSYGRCRAECTETRDCPIATRCIASAGLGVCTLEIESHCNSDVCPSPLLCVDDQCRTECTRDDDCLAGRCVETTCVEPVSGTDAGAPDDAFAPADTGPREDAGPQEDAGPGGCAFAPEPALRALLGAATAGFGLWATTAFVGDVSDVSVPVLALTTITRGGVDAA